MVHKRLSRNHWRRKDRSDVEGLEHFSFSYSRSGIPDAPGMRETRQGGGPYREPMLKICAAALWWIRTGG